MMQQVNLLVDELKPTKEALTFRQLMTVWSVFGLLLVLVSGWQGLDLWRLSSQKLENEAQVKNVQQANRALKARISTEPDPELMAEVESLRQMQAHQELLVNAVAGYESASEQGFSPYLTDLARHHVKGMWLSQISLADGGARIQLQGETTDPVFVPAFLKQLSRGESFKGHRFDGFELEEQESGLLRFDITGPGEARSG
jgi:hypothetical protein